MFVDDGFGNQGFDKTLKDAQFVKNSFTKAGFIINSEKSVLEPHLAL